MRCKRQTPTKRLQGERLGREKGHRKSERRESERNICDCRRKAGRIKKKLKKGIKMEKGKPAEERESMGQKSQLKGNQLGEQGRL